MIVRMWHGRVPSTKAQTYRDFLNSRSIPDYSSYAGNQGVYVMERREGDVTHFITLTFWDSLEAIRAFAGEEDATIARYYPEDAEFLIEFETHVSHYEVVGQKTGR